ncbi:MAG: MarR family winged helix-turn-helix transcriptional regulator [Propylenella sp.]
MDRNASDARANIGDRTGQPAAGETNLGGLSCNVAFHLRLAQDGSFRAFKRHTGESNLRPGWYTVLTLINANPGITPMALSRASGRDKSTLSPILRDLIRHRLVAQSPVPNDRRSYALSLTLEGEEKLARLTAHAEAHDRQIDEIVGPKKKELIELLRRITNSLD